MGEHLFVDSDRCHEDIPYVLDIWNDGEVDTRITHDCVPDYPIWQKIPAGIFLPTIAIGACLGRATGLLM